MNTYSDVVSDPDICQVPLVHPEKVALARSSAPTLTESTDLAAMFRLLGDPTRTRVLYALLAAEELCVCDLAAVVGISETTLSHALRLLRTAHIVVGRRSGRMMFYRLADAHVRMLLELSREHARHEDAIDSPDTQPSPALNGKGRSHGRVGRRP